MSNKLATFTAKQDGSYIGILKTMAVTSQVILAPNDNYDNEKGQPSHRVITPNGYECGAAWPHRSGAGNDILVVKLQAPELGPAPIWANLIEVEPNGQDDSTHILLWSSQQKPAMAA